MKYFLHDTNSFDDEKITELYLKFGYEGIGLFYTFLEKIAKQEKPVKTEILKAQLKVGKRLTKCWTFMEQIGIISSTNGDSFNDKLLNFSESYQIKKEKTRNKVLQWRERQRNNNNVTSYVPVSNHPKVKESKINKSKVYKNSKKIFIPPKIDEVKQFFKESGYSEQCAINAFEYYEDKDWHDKNDNPVSNWKLKMRTVWFKDENKLQEKTDFGPLNDILKTLKP